MDKILIIIALIMLIIIAGGTYFLFQKQVPAENNSVEPQPNYQEASEENPLESSGQETQQEEAAAATFEIQGMKVEILKEGSGETAKTGDTVFVHYVGKLQNGQTFDSSIERGQPFSFTLGQNMVIQGWELGILGMKAGEKRRLTIPSELGYGNQGAGGVIPPVSTLIFEVELIGIN